MTRTTDVSPLARTSTAVDESAPTTPQRTPVDPAPPVRARPADSWLDRATSLRAKLTVMNQVVDWSASEGYVANPQLFTTCFTAAKAVVESIARLARVVARAAGLGVFLDAVVRYGDAVDGWFEPLVGELQAMLIQRATSDEEGYRESRSMARLATFYVRDHLEVLYREAAAVPPPIRDALTTLHGDVVWFNCELEARETEGHR